MNDFSQVNAPQPSFNHASSRQKIVAVFDFDGTLTRKDSFFVFLQTAVGNWRLFWGLAWKSPILMAYLLKLIPNWRAKQALLVHFFAGWPVDRLERVAQRFAVTKLQTLMRSEALQRFAWHQEQGHHMVLISASLEAYLVPWAKLVGIHQVAGTRMEVVEGRLTGRMAGLNCHGPEKVCRLRSLIGDDLGQFVVYAYGDSLGDRELLEVATYPYFRRFS